MDRNLTEWKKPVLTEHLQDEEKDDEIAGKAKLAKHTTMKTTAKVGLIDVCTARLF